MWCLFAPAELGLRVILLDDGGLMPGPYGEWNLSLLLAIQTPACWNLENLIYLILFAPGSLLVSFPQGHT